MSQRPITGYFGSLLSGGENPDTTPTGVTQSEKQLSSPLDSQSGVSIGSDSTTGSDRTANQSASNPDDSRGSSDIGELTVQPDHDTNDNLTQSENNGLHNRSLTEILASAFQGETSPDNPSLVAEVVMLESQLIHETMKLDLERKDNTSMRNQVELLQCELEQNKKLSDKQKQEIKRLLGENDNLRRDLSRYNGMRRFAETGTQPVIDLTDELQSTKVKLQSLKEHMVDITSRMIVALEESPDAERNGDDDDDPPFTLVTHSRRGRQLQRQQSARFRQVVPQPHPPNRRPEIPTVARVRGDPPLLQSAMDILWRLRFSRLRQAPSRKAWYRRGPVKSKMIASYVHDNFNLWHFIMPQIMVFPCSINITTILACTINDTCSTDALARLIIGFKATK